MPRVAVREAVACAVRYAKRPVSIRNGALWAHGVERPEQGAEGLANVKGRVGVLHVVLVDDGQGVVTEHTGRSLEPVFLLDRRGNRATQRVECHVLVDLGELASGAPVPGGLKIERGSGYPTRSGFARAASTRWVCTFWTTE